MEIGLKDKRVRSGLLILELNMDISRKLQEIDV